MLRLTIWSMHRVKEALQRDNMILAQRAAQEFLSELGFTDSPTQIERIFYYAPLITQRVSDSLSNVQRPKP